MYSLTLAVLIFGIISLGHSQLHRLNRRQNARRSDLLTGRQMLGNYRIPAEKHIRSHGHVHESKAVKDHVDSNVKKSHSVDQMPVDGSTSDSSPEHMNSMTCNEPVLLVDESGMLQSPGFDSHRYAHNLSCTWSIEAPFGQLIKLEFQDINVDSSVDCVDDSVSIYDGMDNNAHMLGTLCGQLALQGQPFISSSSSMFVSFTSDNVTADGTGFKAVYHTITHDEVHSYNRHQSMDPACLPGQPLELTAPSGTFQSYAVNTTGHYMNRQTCQWKIQVTEGKRIRLHFTEFALESHPICAYDGVHVFDGEDEWSPMLAYFCGQCLPVDIISTSNVLFVQFFSDFSVTFSGFVASYAAVEDSELVSGTLDHMACGKYKPVTLQGDVGEFASPCHSGGQYATSVDCQWLLRVPQQKVVQLGFAEFRLEKHFNCIYDKVVVYDGHTTDATILGEFCGSNPPSDVISSGSELLVRFISDHDVTSEGFLAVFSSVPVPAETSTIKACGVERPFIDVDVAEGIISSPFYPMNYPSASNCAWKLQTDYMKRIELSFEDFSLEWHKNCSWDNLLIYDGADNTANLISSLCGSRDITKLVSSTNQLYIEFHSDDMDNDSGFLIQYTVLNTAVEACGPEAPFVLRSTSGMIASPRDVITGQYPNNANCEWLIVAPLNMVFMIHLRSLDMEDDIACKWDRLALYDCERARCDPLTVVCGHTMPHAIVSTGHKVTINFLSDTSITSTGFVLEFQALSEEELNDLYPPMRDSLACGNGNQLVLESNFGSINYPTMEDSYPDNTECQWILNADENQYITLNFTMLGIEHHDDCDWDSVRVYNGSGNNGTLLASLCGKNLPGMITAKASTVLIQFKSDAAINGPGFQLRYRYHDKSPSMPPHTPGMPSGVHSQTSNTTGMPVINTLNVITTSVQNSTSTLDRVPHA